MSTAKIALAEIAGEHPTKQATEQSSSTVPKIEFQLASKNFDRKLIKYISEYDPNTREYAIASGKYDPLRDNQNEDPIIPAMAPTDETARALQARFDKNWDAWENSVDRARVTNILDQYIEQYGRPQLKNFVLIGLGSLSGPSVYGGLEDRDTVCSQLAASLGMVDLLRIAGEKVPLYAQDPIFNQLDTELLESMGVTVVKQPDVWKEIRKDSFLFMPKPEEYLHWGVAMLQPAVLTPMPLRLLRDSWHENLDEFLELHFAEFFRVEEDRIRVDLGNHSDFDIYLPAPV